MKSRSVFFAIAITSLLAACGGSSDDSSVSEKEYVDALVSGLERDSNDGGTGFTSEENVCIAEGIVRIIGTKAFEDAGLTPDELAANDQATLPDVSDAKHEELRKLLFDGDCVDMVEAIASSFSGASSGVAGAEQITCLAEAVVGNEEMQSYIVDGLLGRDTTKVEADVSTIVQSAAADCGIGS